MEVYDGCTVPFFIQKDKQQKDGVKLLNDDLILNG